LSIANNGGLYSFAVKDICGFKELLDVQEVSVSLLGDRFIVNFLLLIAPLLSLLFILFKKVQVDY
jgi:hypothetical protein